MTEAKTAAERAQELLEQVRGGFPVLTRAVEDVLAELAEAQAELERVYAAQRAVIQAHATEADYDDAGYDADVVRAIAARQAAELARLKQPAHVLAEAQDILRAEDNDGVAVTHVFFAERAVLLTVWDPYSGECDYEGATLAEAYEQWTGVDGPDLAKLTGGDHG